MDRNSGFDRFTLATKIVPKIEDSIDSPFACPLLSIHVAGYITATRTFLAVSGLGSIAAINFIWGQGLLLVWLPDNTTRFGT